MSPETLPRPPRFTMVGLGKALASFGWRCEVRRGVLVAHDPETSIEFYIGGVRDVGNHPTFSFRLRDLVRTFVPRAYCQWSPKPSAYGAHTVSLKDEHDNAVCGRGKFKRLEWGWYDGRSEPEAWAKAIVALHKATGCAPGVEGR